MFQKSFSIPSFIDIKRPAQVSAKNLHRSVSIHRQKIQADGRFYYASIALITANLAVLAMYFVGVNTYAGKGYEIRDLQNKIESLSDTQKKLNLKIAEQSSVLGLQTDFTNAHYVPVTGATFLQTSRLSDASQSMKN